MEIRTVKEKEPELKLKKEAEIAVHKGNPAVTKKEHQIVCSKESGSALFEKRYEEDFQKENKDMAQEKILSGDCRKRSEDFLVSAAIKEKHTQKKNGKIMENGVIEKKAESTWDNRRDAHSGFHPRTEENKNIMTNLQARSDYRRTINVRELSKDLKIRSARVGPMIHVKHSNNLADTSREEGGEALKRSNPGTDRTMQSDGNAAEIPNQTQTGNPSKLTGRKKKAAGRSLRREGKENRKIFHRKGQNRAVRMRGLQFMLDQLSGSGEQDSLGQMAKDMIRMKASLVTGKAVRYLGAFLAPLSGMVFLAAFPVVLIIVLLYCSPIAAFMENPSGDTPSIQEVLGEYYMEFNQAVSANAGENGTVAYLHEKDGNYVSNYMDTLMVYMVQYGTGDLGIVMDEKHKRLLKQVFDEMNSLEDKTVTTTIQAGQSLGNVITSAYCACSICCGQWAGGPTASGAMPKADHTIAVDAADPFVPMGTRVIMGGREYVVEDTGAFARYGVQFDIYFDNHAAASNWGHVTMEAFLADGDENTVSVTKKGSYVKNLDFEDYIALGKLTREQEELLREVMDADFRSEIPSSGTGSDAANLALTKVGCQYSQERRYEEGYYDCSSLVQRCYAQFGINLPAIASTQGQYMVEHGLEVAKDMLEPGDLIFYSYESNGQFRNISHVAIYIGNGRMVHASSPERGVVNDPFSPSNVGLYGRPGRGK